MTIEQAQRNLTLAIARRDAIVRAPMPYPSRGEDYFRACGEVSDAEVDLLRARRGRVPTNGVGA